MEYNEVKDSGQRQEFTTGSVRDTNIGKGRFDLIPAYPLERLAKHYENGSRKYSDGNWLLGQPLSRYLDSAMRHMNKVKQGLEDEDHAIAVAWNIFAFIETKRMIEAGELPEELKDVPLTVNAVRGKMWKDIPNNYPYQANMLGQIRNSKTGRVLKPWKNMHGYLLVGICNGEGSKGKSVHRLVAAAFFGESELQVNHKDGNKENNSPTNLEYATQSDNMRHAFETELRKVEPKGKLTIEDVIAIRQRIVEGEKSKDLATEYNVSESTISDINNNRTWRVDNGQAQETRSRK